MKQRGNPARRTVALQLTLILLLLSLLCGMLIAEHTRNQNKLQREQVRSATYVACDTLTGYVFRNETALRSNNNGPIAYTAANGAAVQAGDTLAQVYIDDTGKDKREQAAVLYEKIEERKALLAQYDTAWQSDYVTGYAAAMQAASAGALQTCGTHVSQLAAALQRRDAQAPEAAAALEAEIAALELELYDMVRYVDAPQTVPADTNGLFYRTADGYEALFGTDAVSGLTPAAMQALLLSPVQTDDCIGKLVDTGTWYLALPVRAALAETYTAGHFYTVHFNRGAVQAELYLSEINYDEDGSNALLILCAEQALTGLDVCRRQQVQIEKQQTTGLCIPANALSPQGTVFVDVNGIATERKVAPVQTEGGCLLCAPSTDQTYLQPGEKVLLGTRRLYHGKALN